MNDNIDKNLNLEILEDKELEQVSGGISSEKYKVISDKAKELLRQGKIDSAQLIEIKKTARDFPENDYISWALKCARKNGLFWKDITWH